MTTQVQEQISLAQYTTLHTGGVADYFCRVESVEQLRAALQFATQTAAPLYLLGGGSNVLFPDEGFRGLVIKNEITGITYDQQGDTVLVHAGAGESLDSLVADSVARSYWGLENLSAIPGTVGATPIQNVGAYGVEVSQLIESVVCVHVQTGEEKVFTSSECCFGYRDSFFKTAAGRQWVVVRVAFRLSTIPAPQLTYKDVAHLASEATLTPQIIRDAIIDIRSAKFPDWTVLGTAGSFFKNPVVSKEQLAALHTTFPELPAYQTESEEWKISLGWLLDKGLGLKGFCMEQVCLYEKQALVLVSHKATSDEITYFYTEIQKIVLEKTGVSIEPEVQVIQNEKRLSTH